ncbi:MULTISPECIES: hypothetical protein [Alteribacter]|nr:MULTISPECIES: hypothetical protein [Alteribacter]MBM7096546.1 hypothetical protein [Alteribacter salitolerans]
MTQSQHEPFEEYNPAPLTEEMLEEIRSLESKLREQASDDVILIAYTHK